MISKHLIDSIFHHFQQEYEKHAYQAILLDAQGFILKSNNHFSDLAPYYHQSLFQHSELWESIGQIVTHLPENEIIEIPRVENTLGDKHGFFDYKIYKKKIGTEVFLFCIILDNTSPHQYLQDVQQERNQVIDKTLQKLNHQNYLLQKSIQYFNFELDAQKSIIVQKDNALQQGLAYAAQLQRALLPNENFLNTPFFECFVFHRSKEVVGGDFYWFYPQNDYYWLALADCTGHGVPGAMMTVIGTILLNQLAGQMPEVSAAEMLNHLDQHFYQLLQNTSQQNQVHDGMHIALLKIHPSTNKVEIANAKMPVYKIHLGAMERIEGNRFGINHALFNPKEEVFTSEVVTYTPGDIFYIFSDGFSDQFGGAYLKKFNTKNARKLLLDIHANPLSQQKEMLVKAFDEWKGQESQLDDVLVMGIRMR